MSKKSGVISALDVTLLLTGLACSSYLITNREHPKVIELVLVGIILSVILTAATHAFSERAQVAGLSNTVRAGLFLITTCAFAFFLLAEMPPPRKAEWTGTTLFSKQKSGLFLYKGFLSPEDFYRRHWKFGILLNATYDKYKPDSLPKNFFISWLARTVTYVLTNEMKSHWLIHHQRTPGFGDAWGPDDRSVAARKINWADAKGFDANTLTDIKMPVHQDAVSIPAGGNITYSQDDEGRNAKIVIEGQYAQVVVEVEFLGSPGVFSPYPEWTPDAEWIKKMDLLPVLYAVRAKSNFSKWHWNLTGDQIELEARWVDDIFTLLSDRFNDADFLKRLEEGAIKRAAFKSLYKGKTKHLDSESLTNERIF